MFYDTFAAIIFEYYSYQTGLNAKRRESPSQIACTISFHDEDFFPLVINLKGTPSPENIACLRYQSSLPAI